MILVALPLFHSYGMTTCMNLGVRTRTPLILIVNPRALAHILKSAHRHRPSAYPGVPAFYAAVVNCAELHKYDLGSIKFCISGAAPLPAQIQQGFEQCTGGRLVEGYGIRRVSPGTAQDDGRQSAAACAGRGGASPHVTARFLDSARNDRISRLRSK